MRRLLTLTALTSLLWTASTAAQETAPEPLLDGEVYVLEQRHSLLDFTARHKGFSRVRGTFDRYRAAIFYVADDLASSSVSVVIDVSSIDTGHAGRDAMLRREFFATDEYPFATFLSERVEKTDAGYVAHGPLSIRDVTREVRVPFEIVAAGETDQFKHQRIAFTGAITVNRKDYGVVYDNEFWDGIVSDEIRIDVDVAAVVYNAVDSVYPWREDSIGTVVLKAIEEGGFEAAREQALTIWNERRSDYDVRLVQLYRAGLNLSQKENYDDAVRVFELALELHGEDAAPESLASLYAVLAGTEVRRGDREAALAALAKALEIDPKNPEAYELYRRLGD